MWVRKRIDIGWTDLLSGGANVLNPQSRSIASNAVEVAWSVNGDAFACLSVRSGLDLLLTALQLPAGSEVLVSAMTIPDMVRIIEHHGLVAVPIDLHAEDMSPQVALLEQAVTSRTRAILVAHLLGGRFDLTPIVELARKHDLLLLEDCAQAFEGDRYRGHEHADVSMFSFGPIKTATALGGGVFRIKDKSLLHRMRALQSECPVQSRWFFLKRVLFYSFLKWLGGRIAFGCFVRLCRMFGRDFDQVLNNSIRNFPEDQFFASLREQPSLPLLRLLNRRITRYSNEELDRRAARGRLLASLLPADRCPGVDATPHSFWVFPLQVPDQRTAVAALRDAGFDSTADNSLQPVEPPVDRPELTPHVACDVLSPAIYLPLYVDIPEAEIRRMATVLAPLLEREPTTSSLEANAVH